MSIDQSSYPEWQWDGSLSEDEIRQRLGHDPVAAAVQRGLTPDPDTRRALAYGHQILDVLADPDPDQTAATDDPDELRARLVAAAEEAGALDLDNLRALAHEWQGAVGFTGKTVLALLDALAAAWPCDNYQPPLTCYTGPKPKTLVCQGCREAFPHGPEVAALHDDAIAAAEQRGRDEALGDEVERRLADGLDFGAGPAVRIVHEAQAALTPADEGGGR